MVYIYGAGGMGIETNWLAKDLTPINIAGFIDDFKAPGIFEGLPLINKLPSIPSSIIVSVANTSIRKHLVQQVASAQHQFPNLIHPTAILDGNSPIGIGNIIARGVITTVHVSIGNHTIININTIIGHDSILMDFVSIMSSVNISGNVKIEEGVYIGSGATILPNITIGKYSTIGAGTVVTKDVPPYSTVVGVPGRVIKVGLRDDFRESE